MNSSADGEDILHLRNLSIADTGQVEDAVAPMWIGAGRENWQVFEDGNRMEMEAFDTLTCCTRTVLPLVLHLEGAVYSPTPRNP